jgi:hypothetical protein
VIAVVDDRNDWQVMDVRTGVRCRPARPADADGIAETHVQAACASWTFVDDRHFDALPTPAATWQGIPIREVRYRRSLLPDPQ